MVASTHPPRATPWSLTSRLGRAIRRMRSILRLSGRRFFQIDGTQWAGAFAFSVFISIFPLIMFLVTIAAFFVDGDWAGLKIIAFLESHMPISGEMQRQIIDTIAGVVDAREGAGAVALLLLLWTAHRCFSTLIRATNSAWGIEGYNWWRQPLKSLGLLGILAAAAFVGMGAPILMRMASGWLLPVREFGTRLYGLGSFLVPSLVVFCGLSLFYRLAPRRRTRFAEVWLAALIATVLLRAGENLFVIYLRDFASLNAVYGAFGGITALLLWIYVSGCIFIFGACLCAARTELIGPLVGQSFPGSGNTPWNPGESSHMLSTS